MEYTHICTKLFPNNKKNQKLLKNWDTALVIGSLFQFKLEFSSGDTNFHIENMYRVISKSVEGKITQYDYRSGKLYSESFIKTYFKELTPNDKLAIKFGI